MSKNKNQKLFIEYVVTNLLSLNEAYGRAEVERLTKKFKDQAEAFNIKNKEGNDLTEDDIKAIINGFDQLRTTQQNSIPADKPGIDNWNIKDLIRFVTDKIDITSKEEDEEEEDQTPDVIYSDDNYVIWNGSKEGNCIRYGNGERWCITKGSFGNYRYSADRGFPVFYLAKNKNLPESDKLSFVAIQVRKKPESERYVYTNRRNSPYESNPMSWEELNNEIPWLRNIPDVKDLMKYIGVGRAEEKQRAWGNYNGIPENEFNALPFNQKIAYLAARKSKSYIFYDVKHIDFLENYLQYYPRLQEWISQFPFEFDFESIIHKLDIFTPQQQRSIATKVNNIDHGGNDIQADRISSFPYKNIIKLLELNPKVFPNTESTNLTLLKLGGESYIININYKYKNDVTIKYYDPQRKDFILLKLNAFSEDLFFNNPVVTQLPFSVIVKILKENNLNPKKVRGLLYNIENKKGDFNNGGFDVRTIGDKKVLFDMNSLIPIAYDLSSGNVTKININAPENADIKKEFNESISGNEDFKIKIGTNILKNPQNINNYDLEDINTLFENTPSSTWKQITTNSVDDSGNSYFLNITPEGIKIYQNVGYRINRYGNRDNLSSNDIEDFIRAANRVEYKYNDDGIEKILRFTDRDVSKRIVTNPDFPASEENTYRYINLNNRLYRYQPNNIANSNMWSESRRGWVRGTLRPQDVGQQTAARANRDRPAGAAVPAAAATPAAAAAPAAGGGDINLSDAFTDFGLETGYATLPLSSRRRLQSALASNVQMRGDRGTTARQNQLGTRGRVSSALSINTGGHQPSKVYFITMANGSVIASINIQPGNLNYIVTSTAHYLIDSPRQLLAALQQRNLAEGMKSYIVKNYLTLNPHQIDEVKTMLRAYISNKKK